MLLKFNVFERHHVGESTRMNDEFQRKLHLSRFYCFCNAFLRSYLRPWRSRLLIFSPQNSWFMLLSSITWCIPRVSAIIYRHLNYCVMPLPLFKRTEIPIKNGWFYHIMAANINIKHVISFCGDWIVNILLPDLLLLNTLRPTQNGRIFQTTFSTAFSWMKMYKLRLDFIEVCSQWSN